MELTTKQGFKQTEIGLIPEDWRVRELDHVLKFGSGQDYKHLSKGEIPVYGTGGIMTYVNNHLYNGESVGIGRKGTIDKPVFLSGKFWTVDTLFYTKDFLDSIPKFIYYKFLIIPWKEYNEASGVPSLNKNTLGKIKIALPPTLKEQKAIATALSDVDDLIVSLEGLIAKKQAIKQGAMQQLLTPPHKGGKRLPGFSGEWVEKSLGEILDHYELGGNYENNEIETAFPLIKMGNLGRGIINLNKVHYIPNHVKPLEADVLNFGDILFNTRNTLDLVGKISIWKNELPKAYFNSNIMRLEFNTKHVGSNFFMNFILNTPKVITDLKSFATGTTSVAAIYTRDLLKLEICLPSPKEQKAIAKILSDMNTELEQLETKKAKYQQLKQGMLQELLTGNTRLV
ncbi:Type I restriction enzyme, S subunit [Tenacibaculum maritimum]|uniref:restriction endonuclease subunit S n=1 Tax=Tenacibaculum maritimum TaxID=107401 RepID=UPI0012E4804B|nr:restriction endonuclease subunit S [Tenacibaculum maritimum]CAA0144383.1 Type I restriction enzyme, S subunit [Tenacibaculum maritimum]CAA0144643.1 Type I restriction enzyme, S subunit [Tenacibaculum maritimum]CAA0144944.1 Type I restriction enzyme, S subunit [Tenacibaculum maritimum]